MSKQSNQSREAYFSEKSPPKMGNEVPKKTFKSYIKQPTSLQTRKSFGNHSDLYEDSAEHKLSESEYKVVETIILHPKRGEGSSKESQKPKGIYVKCTNRHGFYVFVDITKGNSNNIYHGLQTTVETLDGSSIIESNVISSAVTFIKEKACGVMFESRDEFCSAICLDNGRTDINTYSITSRNSQSRMCSHGSPVAYPIITIEEIVSDYLKDPKDRSVDKNIGEISIRMLIHGRDEAIDTMKKFPSKVDNIKKALSNVSNAYARVQAGITDQIISSVSEVINPIEKEMFRGLNLTDENKDKYNEARKNISSLNKASAQNFNFINSLMAVEKELDSILSKTERAYWGLFIDVTKVKKDNPYYSEGKDIFTSAVTWGLPPELDNLTVSELVLFFESKPEYKKEAHYIRTIIKSMNK
jgi:hypothetical protein